MSAVVMEEGSHHKRPWHRSSDPAPPSSYPALPGLRTISGANASPHSPFSTLDDQRLPPISTTTFDRTNQPLPKITSPTYLDRGDNVRQPSPLLSPAERPEKRARWHSSQESTTSELRRRTSQDQVSTPGRDEDIPCSPRPHAADTVGVSQTPDVIHHPAATAPWTRRDEVSMPGARNCPNCADTDDLITAVVTALFQLEVDVRAAEPTLDAAPHFSDVSTPARPHPTADSCPRPGRWMCPDRGSDPH